MSFPITVLHCSSPESCSCLASTTCTTRLIHHSTTEQTRWACLCQNSSSVCSPGFDILRSYRFIVSLFTLIRVRLIIIHFLTYSKFPFFNLIKSPWILVENKTDWFSFCLYMYLTALFWTSHFFQMFSPSFLWSSS